MAGFYLKSCPFQRIDLKKNISRKSALIFEFDLLMLGGLDWNEPKVDQRLELHIWGRSKCVEEELELLVMALRLDLHHIMEVTVRI